MPAALRSIFIWLVMLALPAQSIAASTMLFCGPGHHRQQQAADAADGHAAHHHGSPAAPGADAEGHAGHASADAEPGATPLGGTEPSQSKCSVCAACCSGLAILDTPPLAARAELMRPTSPPLAVAFDPVFTEGPDKPPRASLA